MRRTLGKLLSGIYSVVEGVSNAAGTGSSLVMDGSTNYLFAYTIGAMTGIIELVRTYCFQGATIRKKITDSESDPDADGDTLQPTTEISGKRKGAYLVIKYGFILSSLIVNYLSINLLYSEAKAWMRDLKDSENDPLAFLSEAEITLVLLYYILFDLPFMLTNEIPQTCKEISRIMGIPANSTPDYGVTFIIFKLAKPFAANKLFRTGYVRGLGSVADTIEHVAPLVIAVPPPWILKIANSSPIIAWGSAGLSASLFTLVFATILAQTYLFEGKFTEKNLDKIRHYSTSYLEIRDPWMNPRIARLFHYLLYLGGPLHGIGTGLDLLLTLRELKAPEALTYVASPATFLVAWMGNHHSEVRKAQSSLRKITKLSSAQNPHRLLSQHSRQGSTYQREISSINGEGGDDVLDSSLTLFNVF
jgi:hypothetical protein